MELTELNSHVFIVMIEDHCSSARPACGPSRRRNDNGYEQEGRYVTTQQEPQGAGEICLPVRRQERDCRLQARAAQGDGRLPIRDEVPGCSRKVTLLGRIAHGGTLDLRHGEVAVHDAGPLHIPLAGQPAEPDGLALDL